MRKKLFALFIAIFFIIPTIFAFYNIFIRTWKTNVVLNENDIKQISGLYKDSKEETLKKLNAIGEKINTKSYDENNSDSLVKIEAEFSETGGYKNEINISFHFFNSLESFENNNTIDAQIATVSIYFSGEKRRLSVADFVSISEMEEVYDTSFGKYRPIFNSFSNKGDIDNIKYFVSPILIDSKNSDWIGTPFLKSQIANVNAIYEIGDCLTVKIFEIVKNNISHQTEILNYISTLAD